MCPPKIFDQAKFKCKESKQINSLQETTLSTKLMKNPMLERGAKKPASLKNLKLSRAN